jgi:hypothetical protein
MVLGLSELIEQQRPKRGGKVVVKLHYTVFEISCSRDRERR